MTLFHARNTVLRALREVEVAQLEVENLGYLAAFFSRIGTDLVMLAQRLLSTAYDEWRKRGEESSVVPGTHQWGQSPNLTRNPADHKALILPSNCTCRYFRSDCNVDNVLVQIGRSTYRRDSISKNI
jgi:hypothetical protein